MEIEKMHGVVRGVYYCHDNRVQDLNVRIYDRNIPNVPLQANFEPRAVRTRQIQFPAFDCRSPAKTPVIVRPNYNQYTQFNPGSSAPFSGWARHIDQDSRLKNKFMAHHKWTAQTEYIPSSKSDLYNDKTPQSAFLNQDRQLLFQEQSFEPHNPNPCNLGGDLFNNHIRQQLKELPLRE